MALEHARADPARPFAGLNKDWVYLLVSVGLLAAATYVVTQSGADNILRVAARYSAGSLALIIAAFVVSTLLGAYRLQTLARDFGYPLGLVTCVRTVALSQAASNFFFQLYGQLASRGVILQRQGVPVATTVLVTLIERLVALVILLALASGGALTVFGTIHLDAKTGAADLVKLLSGLIAAGGAALLVWRGIAGVREQLKSMDGLAVGVCVLKVALLTVAIQAATLVAFTTAAFALVPDVDLYKVAAASTVVMLASALPISFGGWGVRELSAVFVLGAVVVPPEAAFLSAVTVGLLSFAVVIAMGGATLRSTTRKDLSVATGSEQPDAFVALAWALPLLVAVLIFFQVYLPVANGNLNTCLADPLIIIGASLYLINRRSGHSPTRVPHLGAYIAACTAVILFGLIHGWFAFGSNSWAVTKAFGWFVLIGYALTGALIVRVGQEAGFAALLHTIIAAFLGIALVEYATSASLKLGIGIDLPYAPRMEGFAQDPNAFAFQCLIVMAIALALPATRMRITLLLAACLAMLWLSFSRSGAIAAVAIVAAALVLRPRALRFVATAAVIAALALLAPAAVHWLLSAIHLAPAIDLSGQMSESQILLERDASNSERWETIVNGVWMFLGNPVFGQGLGFFVEGFHREDGSRLIIHSSHVWLLAEFGLVGFAAFALTAWATVKQEWQHARTDWVSAMIMMMMAGYLTMSLAHDLLYQRLFWFVLGAALATRRLGMPAIRSQADSRTSICQ